MLDKMAFFVYVVRLNSISAASKQFDISVSAGSRWLKELEQQMGTPLYRRNNRLLTPTPAGIKLFEEYAPIVDRSEVIVREVQGFQSSQKGHIDISCTPVYANHFLMPIVSEYLREHPGITFNLNITPWALDDATNVDFAVSAIANYQGYRERDVLLVRRELIACPFVVVTSKAYLQLRGAPMEPSELKEHLCLFATSLTGSNDWVFTKENESQIVKIPKSIEVNDSDLLLQGVCNGAGIGYLPDFLVREKVENGELEQLLTEYQTSSWSLNLYYQPQGKASSVAEHFKNYWLKKQTSH
ncbi:LysR family transcriptional regulator [Vibrio sp. MACH09]|uniref:LysR family transcriptional regulator n=1 Tax=unclassified Vibrio TaxID=2614977 RepID=UPI0014937621|nr:MULTISPECIES: LysR family transcriptional regulator [unclassified Vibrio]NOI67448.1 LysR family transcriptional regulator [Vibrio sp. 99-8-1]GLO60760.1 LysR family transcriptional regulator [Vibrio sp. MACH09]